MIKSIHGVTKEPFNRRELALLPQQKQILDIIRIHSQQGGFSVILGEPGVGKSVLKEHIDKLAKEREITVASCTRTLHTYLAILRQLAESFKIAKTAIVVRAIPKKTQFDLVRTARLVVLPVAECESGY
ncbi:MAG: hypothetical protein KZQ97_04665 [Candidatus Thiodiazotropha sp. (ex Dulcina madagascariensis)]|nr:hypothetical protein [Candidatus Thiodiazotropha sp. (ex Dulcina madagascariensis)]